MRYKSRRKKKIALGSQQYEKNLQKAHNLVQNMANLAIFKPSETYKNSSKVKYLFTFELKKSIPPMRSKFFCQKRVFRRIVDCNWYKYLVRKFNISRNSCIFFLLDGGWSFWIASIWAFNGVIVFVSITFPKKLTRVRKNVIYQGLLSSVRVVMSNNIFLDCEDFVIGLWLHKNIV